MFNLRNFIFGSFVVGCTIAATNVSALQCHSTDCKALGYSKTKTLNCEKEIKCPYDDTYTACIQLKDEFIKGECPTGYTCETKYKMTGCVEGYTKVGNTCIVECTGLIKKLDDNFVYDECIDQSGKIRYTKTDQCKTGYVRSKDGSSCYDEKCELTSTPQILGASVDETDSGYVVKSCQASYVSTTDENGCITGCTYDYARPTNKKCPYECFDAITDKCCDETCSYEDRKCIMPNKSPDIAVVPQVATDR